MVVFLLGLIIYFKERRRPDLNTSDQSPSDLKLWIAENVRDPILKAIREGGQ